MKAWEEFLKRLDVELGQEVVDKWLRSLKVVNFDARNLFLEAKDSFQILWFEEHIRLKVVSSLINSNSKKVKVHLSIANQQNGQKKSKDAKKGDKFKENPRVEITFDSLDPLCTFDSFLVYEENNVPFQVLTDAISTIAFNPIFIFGQEGAGKSHLLMSIAQKMREHGKYVTYVRAETFTEHVIAAIRSGDMGAFRQAYRQVDALIVDDVHLFSKKWATQEEFFHTFNTLHLSGKQIFLSANCPPQELQFIEPRLISRFEWGIVFPIVSAQDKKREDLLYQKAQKLQYPLHQKVASFLLETFKSSPKALIKGLEALILRAHLNQQEKRTTYMPMTVPLAKHYLSDLIIEEQRHAITHEKIVQACAECSGIRTEDILGKAQSRDCALPRQIAMYLCRKELKFSFTKIGDLFGRDHSTVMSSVKGIQKSLDEQDAELHATMQAIQKKL